MYFEVRKDSETHENLKVFWKKRLEAENVAKFLVKELGCQQYYKKIGFYGGIDGIVFKEKQDKSLWKKVCNDQFAYYPTKKNAEIYNKIENLPVISYEELNSIIGFTSQRIEVGKKATWIASTGLNYRNGTFSFEVDDACVFTPSADLEEIIFSRYKMLTSPIQD